MCVYKCVCMHVSLSLPPLSLSLTCEDGPSLLEGGGCQAQSQQQGVGAQVVVEAEDVGLGGDSVQVLLGPPLAQLVLCSKCLITHSSVTGRHAPPPWHQPRAN